MLLTAYFLCLVCCFNLKSLKDICIKKGLSPVFHHTEGLQNKPDFLHVSSSSWLWFASLKMFYLTETGSSYEVLQWFVWVIGLIDYRVYCVNFFGDLTCKQYWNKIEDCLVCCLLVQFLTKRFCRENH